MIKYRNELPETRKNHRYELIDASFGSEKIPLVLSNDDYMLNNTIQSLYKYIYDIEPGQLVDVEFEYLEIMQIQNFQEYSKVNFNGIDSRNFTEKIITVDKVIYQEIDKIIFPEILLASRPCCFSSEDSYKIIRNFVKNNINPKVSQITSDYDFCFTVKKKIPLCKPHNKVSEIFKHNGKSYRPPKVRTNLIKEKLETIFEMTNSKDRYEGYTVIPEFKGENHEDLKQNVEKYLQELIEFINLPLEECPNCSGSGVLFKNKI